MEIGNLVLENPLILAPMAGITQLPFRRLTRELGCALVVTEMVSANGLVYGGERGTERLKSHPAERPLAAQIFGADPEMMRAAAQLVQVQEVDLLDINLGCSVRKVIKQGAGAALMREPERLKAILKAVRAVVSLPMTVKMRTGWDPSGNQAITAARIAEDCGVDAVAIHARTAPQGFKGCADWSLIARLKACLSIPVIGNGDILKPEDVLKMQRETGCDGMMIGRASIGNPWIFPQALDLLHAKQPRALNQFDRLQGILQYIDYSVSHFGEARVVSLLRNHLGWFVKGLPGAKRFRTVIGPLSSAQEMIEAVRAYFQTQPE